MRLHCIRVHTLVQVVELNALTHIRRSHMGRARDNVKLHEICTAHEPVRGTGVELH